MKLMENPASAKRFLLSDADYLDLLDQKLNEELAEYQESKSPEELADLLEVIHAVMKARGWTLEKLEQVSGRESGQSGRIREKDSAKRSIGGLKCRIQTGLNSLSGVGKTDTHSFYQVLTEPDKGAEVVNKLLAEYPCFQSNRRWRDQQDLASVQRDA